MGNLKGIVLETDEDRGVSVVMTPDCDFLEVEMNGKNHKIGEEIVFPAPVAKKKTNWNRVISYTSGAAAAALLLFFTSHLSDDGQNSRESAPVATNKPAMTQKTPAPKAETKVASVSDLEKKEDDKKPTRLTAPPNKEKKVSVAFVKNDEDERDRKEPETPKKQIRQDDRDNAQPEPRQPEPRQPEQPKQPEQPQQRTPRSAPEQPQQNRSIDVNVKALDSGVNVRVSPNNTEVGIAL